MIRYNKVYKYCRKDEIEKIENYELAKNDPNEVWEIHHRLELTLDGEFAHTYEELKRLDMYYKRPYFELIFLTKSEHRRLHHKGKHNSDETRKKLSEAMKGKPVTAEHRQKLSEAKKGENHPFYGKHRSAETCTKIAESVKRSWARRKQLL